MIVVRVELWSAVTGEKTEIARMQICNTGKGTERMGNYVGRTFVGRSAAALDRMQVSREAEVVRWPRLQLHVWALVARMLVTMGYGNAGLRPGHRERG